MKRVIEVIPAKIKQPSFNNPEVKKKRVAAYARVSTDSDEQQTSYDMQVKYYTDHIKSNPEWEFVNVYTDEGLSGVMTKHREGFQAMIKDALQGKIDFIITKSISRFARNTVDTLVNIRKLKEKGVEVYFEKENIYTLDAKGEVMITIMSSLAQEESRSISENVTWGKRKRFAEGQVYMPYKNFLGYKRGDDGKPEIVPEEAEVVRRIFHDFLYGLSYTMIAKNLTKEGIPSPGGRAAWQYSTVRSILSNEKYKGDALLQKTYCTDFLTKKMKANEGEIPQYYVENSHDAIVSSEVFEMTQIEMKRRKEKKEKHTSVFTFSGKLICESCGRPLTRKVWHSTSKYRRVVWQCGHKYQGDEKCKTPHLYEDEIKKEFVIWINDLLTNLPEIKKTSLATINNVLDTSCIEERLRNKTAEADILYEKLKVLLQKNSKSESDVFHTMFNSDSEKHEALRSEIEMLTHQIEDKKRRQFQINLILDDLEHQPELIQEFDEKLWTRLVEQVIVTEQGDLQFELKA